MLRLDSGALVLASALGCSAIDLVCGDEALLLERIRAAVGDPAAALSDDPGTLARVGLAAAMRSALAGARSMRPSHLDLPWEEYEPVEPADATVRADAAVTGLEALRSALAGGTASFGEAAAYGLVVPGVPWTAPMAEEVRVALLASADARLLAAAEAALADERLGAVFGEALPAGGSFAARRPRSRPSARSGPRCTATSPSTASPGSRGPAGSVRGRPGSRRCSRAPRPSTGP